MRLKEHTAAKINARATIRRLYSARLSVSPLTDSCCCACCHPFTRKKPFALVFRARQLFLWKAAKSRPEAAPSPEETDKPALCLAL
jgi:hypothetical protein